ncbi:MAG: crossover junction endodeoxyribonuclease RuvC [Candidatus Pacebacteria bacterium]|nr:crossover junction endodeoxyribonuclease RuvC [Candidatus Paceibacterota bacterium]
MQILGFDPGTKRLGYGIIRPLKNHFKVLTFGCFEPKSLKEEKILEEIFQEAHRLIKKYKPDLIAVEKIFFFQNQKTAFQISQVRGVLLLASSQNNIPVFQPTPLEIKTCLTGYGRADKKDVGLMVKQILQLKKIPEPDDITDALACALTAFYSQKRKLILK